MDSGDNLLWQIVSDGEEGRARAYEYAPNKIFKSILECRGRVFFGRKGFRGKDFTASRAEILMKAALRGIPVFRTQDDSVRSKLFRGSVEEVIQ